MVTQICLLAGSRATQQNVLAPFGVTRVERGQRAIRLKVSLGPWLECGDLSVSQLAQSNPRPTNQRLTSV